RLEVAIALRDLPTATTRDALLKLAHSLDSEDSWYLPALAGTLRIREPDLIQQLFERIDTPADEAKALALAWQLNRAESVPFLAGVLKAPKVAEHFQKSLDALSWIAHLSAGLAIETVAASDPNINHRRAALEALRRKIQ